MRIRVLAAAVCTTFTLALTGCTLANTATSTPVPFSTISGHAMGGQQPLSGSTIYVMQASSGSQPTILNGSGTVTDGGGGFSLSGTYSCAGAGNQLYLLAVGGNPGLAAGTNNTHIALITALGPCPSTAGDLSASYPRVTINEATTVAAAYAFAPFSTGPKAISLGRFGGGAGYGANMQTALSLVSPVTGFTYSTTPSGNGTVPLATINTLANIISACVNTDGTIAAKNSGPPATAATPCYTLFNAAPNKAGTIPTDTFTALLNMAQNPGFVFDSFGQGSNIGNLYTLTSPSAPFQPSLTTQPSDLTLEVTYTGGGLSGAQTRPRTVAVDTVGNIWTINTNNTVSEMNYLGAPVSPAGGYTGVSAAPLAPAFNLPVALAGDLSGAMGVIDQGSNAGNGSIRTINQAGAVQSYYAGLNSPVDVTALSNGSSSYAIAGNANNVYALTQNGTTFNVTSATNAALNQPVAITFDGSKIYVANATGNALSTFTVSANTLTFGNTYTSSDSGVQASIVANPAGSSVWVSVVSSNSNNTTGVSRFQNGAFTGPFNNPSQVNHSSSLAVSQAGNIWVTSAGANQSPIYVLNDAGTNISGFHGLVTDVVPTAIAIDSFGNVWFRNANDGTLRELIGSAAPATAPIVNAYN